MYSNTCSVYGGCNSISAGLLRKISQKNIFPQTSMQLLKNKELEVLFSIYQWIVAEIIYSLPTVPIIFLCGLTGSLCVQSLLVLYLHIEKRIYWHKLSQPNWLWLPAVILSCNNWGCFSHYMHHPIVCPEIQQRVPINLNTTTLVLFRATLHGLQHEFTFWKRNR